MSLLFRFLGALTGALLAASFILILSKILSNRRSLAKFKRLSRSMPMFDDARLLGNHISSFVVGVENCRKTMELHARHGPNIGGLMGDKFAVSTIDLDLVKRIVLDEGHLHLDRTSLDLPLREFDESMMLLPGHRWKPLRRVFAPALKSNKFKVPNVIREIEDSIGKLVAYIDGTLDRSAAPVAALEADDFAHKYTLDVVFSCFYKQYDLIDFDDPKDRWTRLMDAMMHELHTSPWVKCSMIFAWSRHVVGWLMWHFHKQGFARRRILEFIKRQTKLRIEARRQIKEHKARGRAMLDETNFLLSDGTKFSHNIIDTVIDAFLDGKLTKDDYFNSTFFLLVAADVTASDCIIHTLYLLSVHQDVQERLRESIKAEGADSEYLGWVLHESLRLLPPAPVGCSRTVSHSIELADGHVIPEGTFVITNAFVIHRLTKYWGEDAHEFRPERWRDTSEHHPVQFLAFGAGQRGCPGREFALFQMKMLFAALLTRYKFQGQPRDDAYKFSSPCLLIVIPNSPTIVEISRLEDEK